MWAAINVSSFGHDPHGAWSHDTDHSMSNHGRMFGGASAHVSDCWMRSQSILNEKPRERMFDGYGGSGTSLETTERREAERSRERAGGTSSSIKSPVVVFGWASPERGEVTALPNRREKVRCFLVRPFKNGPGHPSHLLQHLLKVS